MRAIVAAGLALTVNVPAMAGEVKRLNNEDGINVTYRAESERYCISTHSGEAADRFNLRVHAKECRTKDGWARQGLTLVRRGESAQQVASAD
ncbi:hypothetical protein D1610_08040 [Sphingomonas gilva]|uniref:UrcA family protein n=2 Tax=Sphingomonas gilva TaxID=2305907 RepID=A0A396RPF9_9SPHN|nr:hypothetical protein D1610_08040 [Sphingomonas gilva]